MNKEWLSNKKWFKEEMIVFAFVLVSVLVSAFDQSVSPHDQHSTLWVLYQIKHSTFVYQTEMDGTKWLRQLINVVLSIINMALSTIDTIAIEQPPRGG